MIAAALHGPSDPHGRSGPGNRTFGGPFYWFDGVNTVQMANLTAENATAVGQMLWDANFASVNSRYSERCKPETFNYRKPHRRLTTVEALKAIHGYEYQSCEHPEWSDSSAYNFCQMLQKKLISVLPGYDEANTWSIND